MYLILLVSIIQFIPRLVSLNCTENSANYEFHRISTNQKSTQTIIAINYFTSIVKCAEFTKRKGGLAFNYSAYNAVQFFTQPNNLSATSHHNCEVLDCPEIGAYNNLINDTRYEYYSLYLNTNNTYLNVFCIPGVGLFKLHNERKSYINARKSCADDDGGLLADILSCCERTNTLSKALSKIRHAWIGLREMERKTNYITSRDKSINCYRFRAWYPGHPKKRNTLNCVVLTNNDAWKAMDCSTKLPYICELPPAPPAII